MTSSQAHPPRTNFWRWPLVVAATFALSACGSGTGSGTGGDGGGGGVGGGTGGSGGGGSGGGGGTGGAGGGGGTGGGGSGGGGGVGGGGSGGGGGTGGGAPGTIDIFLAGDHTPDTFVDGLAGQTPVDYEIALSRYHVLTSAADPSPVLCFEHAQPVVADMAGDNLVGSCDTSTVPTGSYTHGRTKVDWARYTVDGTYHGVTVMAGQYTFFRAYSDGNYFGTDYLAGGGTVRFVSGATDIEIPWIWLDLPSGGGIVHDTTGGEYTMTFPFTTPLPIEQSSAANHWARLNWNVFESFRWQDLAFIGFVDEQWDTSSVPGGSEIVYSPGVTGYHVTSSED